GDARKITEQLTAPRTTSSGRRRVTMKSTTNRATSTAMLASHSSGDPIDGEDPANCTGDLQDRGIRGLLHPARGGDPEDTGASVLTGKTWWKYSPQRQMVGQQHLAGPAREPGGGGPRFSGDLHPPVRGAG